LIKCECGREKYGPLEAADFLGVSGATLNKYRREGWLQASDYLAVGYLYTREALEECARELQRRNTEVEYATR